MEAPLESSAPAALGERFMTICRVTDDLLKQMPRCDRDRMLQEHLAAVRGPVRNFLAICQATDAFAPVRRERMSKERGGYE